MTIYLHFLNRETYRAVDGKYRTSVIEHALRVLALARSDDLYTNYSNLLEGELLDRPGSTTLVRDLLRLNHLLIEGERPTIGEFVESRVARYSFDAMRYPMYFQPKFDESSLLPTVIRRASATEQIHRDILSVYTHERSLADIGVAPFDAPRIGQALPAVARTVMNRGDRAITRSLFDESLSSSVVSNSVARMISSSYIRRHMIDLGADIATGVTGLGAFDHLARGDWSTDVRLLDWMVCLCGFQDFFAATAHADQVIASVRGTGDQCAFAAELQSVASALADRFSNETFVLHAREVYNRLARASDGLRFSQIAHTAPLAEAARRIRAMANVLRQEDEVFNNAYEAQKRRMGMRTVLIVTATKVETQALLSASRSRGLPDPIAIQKPLYVALDLGQLSDLRLVGVQCEAGSVGATNSQAVASDAIRDFQPSFVIMGGIAFGAQKAKQGLGDILVGRFIVEYERAKLKEGVEIPRGPRKECSPKLLSVFRLADALGHATVPVHFGLLLSGEKLVDDQEFLAERLKLEPEAIGGEMEGAGLAAAADRSGVPWIVVKAIVDWGAGKEGQNGEEHQRDIAAAAFEFIVRTIAEVGV